MFFRSFGAATALALLSTMAQADSFSYGPCNLQSGTGYKAVLLVRINGVTTAHEKGFRGLDHRVMFSPWLAELWIRRAFPDATEGLDARSGMFCAGTTNIDERNNADDPVPPVTTPPETEPEFPTCEGIECEYFSAQEL